MVLHCEFWLRAVVRHTNCDGLDLNTILDVGRGGVVRVLVVQYALAAQGVDKGGAACSKWTCQCRVFSFLANDLSRRARRFVCRENWGHERRLGAVRKREQRGSKYLFLRHRRPSDRTEFPSSRSSYDGSSSEREPWLLVSGGDHDGRDKTQDEGLGQGSGQLSKVTAPTCMFKSAVREMAARVWEISVHAMQVAGEEMKIGLEAPELSQSGPKQAEAAGDGSVKGDRGEGGFREIRTAGDDILDYSVPGPIRASQIGQRTVCWCGVWMDGIERKTV